MSKTAEEILQEKLNSIREAIKAENAEALKVAIEAVQTEAAAKIKGLETELTAQKDKFTAFEIKAKKQELNSVAGFMKKNNEALKQLAEHLKNKKEAKAYLQISSKDLTDTTAIEDGTGAIITRNQTNFGSNMSLAQTPAVERIDAFDVFENSGVTLVPLTGNATSVPYVDEEVTGDVAPQNPEGTEKAQLEPVYVERVANTKTYAGTVRVSDQMLEDLILLQTWIFDMLRRKLKVAYNTDFFVGTGTAGRTNSLTTLSTPFDATGLLLGAGAAVGIYEVINAAITQARLSNYNIDRVFMNPIDYYKMLSERSDQGRVNQVVALQVANGYIGTARIVLTPYVIANSLFVAEIGLVKTIYRSNMFGMPEIGLNGNDFKSNMKTIRAHVRLEHVVHEIEKLGIIYVANIEAAITTIASDPIP